MKSPQSGNRRFSGSQAPVAKSLAAKYVSYGNFRWLNIHHQDTKGAKVHQERIIIYPQRLRILVHPVFAYFLTRDGFYPRSQAPAWATPLKPSDTSTSNTPDRPFLRHSQAVRAACLIPSWRNLKPVNNGKQELSTQVRSQAGAWERERGMP
jgi:hypothetical protein